MDPLRLAIVAPLSLKGKEARRALHASGLPIGEVVLLDRDEAKGALTDYAGEPRVVEPMSAEALESVDVLLFCDAPDLLRRALPRLEERGAVVLDLTGGLELGRRGRVVVSGVNQAAEAGARLFRIPHPATVVLATLLAALGEGAPVLRADGVVFEPVSERGEAALDELHAQAVEVLNFRPPPTELLGGRLAFNLLPLTGPAGARAEARVREELRHVLGAGAPAVSLSFVRAPVFLGFALAVGLELEQEEDAAAVAGLLDEAPLVSLGAEAPATPGDLPEEAPGDPVHVSIVEAGGPGRLWLWSVCDALRRGSVSNAIELLERLVRGR